MSRSRTASCILIAVALTGGAVSALPPAAGGQAAAPTVTIEGQAVVGSTLIAVWQPIDPTVTIEYRWQRCTGDVRSSCDRIPGAATVSSYTVTAPDDVGRRLAVRAVSTGAGAAWSPLTDVVTVPPVPTPTPTPEPTPDPTPTPTPTPDPDPEPRPRDDDPPTFDQSGPPSPPPTTLTPIASGSEEPPRLLRPFPVVRVKGTLLRGGARISLMRVRAPSTATVDVRCNGPRCRVRERSFGSGRIAALERFLRAGTRITIRVSKPNAVGKYVRIVIRDGTAPERRDACLLPGSGKAVDCPKA